MSKHPFDHFLITRFSYRGARGCSVEIDPLNEHRLSKRFELFEAVCLPSVLSQQEKAFKWILIVDARLPPAFRQRLDHLIDEHPLIHLHVFEPGTRIETLDWLKDYLDPTVDHVLTTALDDDDALCTGYIRALHHHIRGLDRDDALPNLKLFGCTQAIQWDYYATSQAPLGYVKPWLRGRTSAGAFPLQSGFSALSKRSMLPYSSYYFRHTLGDLILIDDAAFDQLSLATQRKIGESRNELKLAATQRGLDWNRLCTQGAFTEVIPEQPCVLMVNTMTNLQQRRLFEYHEERQAVADESAFSGFGIDWRAALQSIPSHGCTPSNFLAAVLPAYKVAFQTGIIRSPGGFLGNLKRALRITFRCVKGMLDLQKR